MKVRGTWGPSIRHKQPGSEIFFSKDDHDLLRVRLPPHVRRWGSVRYDLKRSGSDSIPSRKFFIARSEAEGTGSGKNKMIWCW